MNRVNTMTILLIAGMKDNNSREIVVEALESIRGVMDVHVNLYRASAIVIHAPDLTEADLIAVVQRAGYDASLASSGVDRQMRADLGANGGLGDSDTNETTS
jgi:copper chaperone CopZ